MLGSHLEPELAHFRPERSVTVMLMSDGMRSPSKRRIITIPKNLATLRWRVHRLLRCRRVSLKRTDQSYLIRDAEPEDVQLTRSDGAYVFDAKGKKYIDFVSGWCVGNLGWGQREN